MENNQCGYRICSRCVMDTADLYITFDENGYCNYCTDYLENRKKNMHDAQRRLDGLVSRIKNDGKGKKYDCIIGVSGGVDSSYAAYTAKKLGLRPLAVHFDNGWNSELAVMNIEKILNVLDLDLYTYVMDWEEFRDLQLSFLKASVPDCEIPTDHGILGLLYDVAQKEGVKYIISGSNNATEGIMGKGNAYGIMDWKYINGVQKRYGSIKLRGFPHFSFYRWLYITFVKNIRTIPILNYQNFNLKDAIDVLKSELGWREYAGKHHESIYTKFYQSYILPVKFNHDRRRGYFSTKICSGQMTRVEALQELEVPFHDENEIEAQIEYIAKKFHLSVEELNAILAYPKRSYSDFPNYTSHMAVFSVFKRIKGRLVSRTARDNHAAASAPGDKASKVERINQ